MNPRPSDAGRWLADLPLPAAVLDGDGVAVWRNPRWLDLDPIDGIPFVWPLEFFAHLQRALGEHSATVLRSVPDRARGSRYDLWLGPIPEEPGRAWVVAAEVTLYETAQTTAIVEARVREASVMIQGILHEMRNPLAGIKGTVQLLQRRELPDEATPLLEQILGDIARIDDVFQELTVLAGALKLARRPTNLHALLEEALGNLAPLCAQRAIAVERHYDPSLPELEVDPDRIYRVYLNLLRNAMDASPRGSTLWIVTEADPHWRSTATGSEGTGRIGWVTRICDEGDGIDDAARPNLFTPLYTTKRTGTGLGLPISLQIVQAHGGALSLRNRDDARGAEATVILPIHQEPRRTGKDDAR